MKINKIEILLLSIGLLIISLDVMIINISYKKKIEYLEDKIKQVELDYQFLKYNKEQLKEYYGKQKDSQI